MHHRTSTGDVPLPACRISRGLATSFGAATLLRLSLRSFGPVVPEGLMFPSSVPACSWAECPAPDRFHRAFDRRCLRLRSEGRSIRNIQPSLPGLNPATEPHQAVPHHGPALCCPGFCSLQVFGRRPAHRRGLDSAAIISGHRPLPDDHPLLSLDCRRRWGHSFWLSQPVTFVLFSVLEPVMPSLIRRERYLESDQPPVGSFAPSATDNLLHVA
jgi:hypothetical protein